MLFHINSHYKHKYKYLINDDCRADFEITIYRDEWYRTKSRDRNGESSNYYFIIIIAVKSDVYIDMTETSKAIKMGNLWSRVMHGSSMDN